MTTTDADHFNGMACRWLGNDQVRLAITTKRGPRIVFCGWREGPNLFAELPEAKADTPDGPYHFLGGHRLWYAPEVLNRTYGPDADPVAVTEEGAATTFTAPPDPSGIAKQITVAVAPDRPEVRVTHNLHNTGRWAVQLAPWAVSMCRTGGVALLPQPQGPTDPGGFLPNRRFSLWPYTDITDDRIVLGNRITLVRAIPGPNNKIGYRNTHGWFAYWLDGTLLSKHFDPHLPGTYPDQDCNAEFFFSQDVIELESLGPFVLLEPGAQVTHEETWRLHRAEFADHHRSRGRSPGPGAEVNLIARQHKEAAMSTDHPTASPILSRRASGILLHPTSLPGPWGIGDLGPAANTFVDFLHATGQQLWEVLPLHPTGYGDSPYQGLSAFAGNPNLISPDRAGGGRPAARRRPGRDRPLPRRPGGFRRDHPAQTATVAARLRAIAGRGAPRTDRRAPRLPPGRSRLAGGFRPVRCVEERPRRRGVDRLGR